MPCGKGSGKIWPFRFIHQIAPHLLWLPLNYFSHLLKSICRHICRAIIRKFHKTVVLKHCKVSITQHHVTSSFIIRRNSWQHSWPNTNLRYSNICKFNDIVQHSNKKSLLLSSVALPKTISGKGVKLLHHIFIRICNWPWSVVVGQSTKNGNNVSTSD